MAEDDHMEHVEETPTAQQKPPPKELLDIFWPLAEGDESKRNEATKTLISFLQGRQTSYKRGSWKACHELRYTVTRLIRGAASSRQWARLGFTTALTQVLRHFQVLTVPGVLTEIDEKLVFEKGLSKKEKSSVLLAKLMCYLALIQSGKLAQGSGEDVAKVTNAVVDLRQKRTPLHHVCTQALVLLAQTVDEDTFRQQVWPAIQAEIDGGWKTCTPDILLLVLALTKHQSAIATKKYIKEHWQHSTLISEENFESIASVLMQSTCDHPIIHPVCYAVIRKAAKKEDKFCQFWTDVFNRNMYGPQKKYLCYRMIPVALKLATQVAHVETILSRNLLHTVLENLNNKAQPLHKAAKQLTEDLVEFVKSSSNGSLQVAVVKALITSPGSVLFDAFTKTRTVNSMMQSLNPEGAREFAEILQRMVRGEAVLGKFKSVEDAEAKYRWATSQMSNLITVSMATDEDWQCQLLQFLLLHAFFDVKQVNKEIPHCHQTDRQPLPQSARDMLQDVFFKCLHKVATFHPDRSKPRDLRLYIDTLYNLVQYAQVLLESTNTAIPVRPFNEEVMENWNKMRSRVEKIRAKLTKDRKMTEGHAFELLFLLLGLQLFTDPAATVDVLQDLHVCCDKATLRKRRASMKKSDSEEPEWVEVMTEMLLSMLSQQSVLVRRVVSSAFSVLCPHLTPAALKLILSVLKLKNEEEEEEEEEDEGPLGFEEEEGEGGQNDPSEPTEEEEVEEDDSDESDVEEKEEEETGAVDEQLRARVKAALGDAAVASDEEASDDEFDDDAMMRLDGALADAFRSMKKSTRTKADKEREVQLKHYKVRCLDLVDILITSDPPASMLPVLLMPMLDLMEAATKDKSLREIGNRATKTFHNLVKPRKLLPDPTLDRTSLPQLVRDLIQYSKKVSGVLMVKEVASACLFVVRLMLQLDSNTGPSPVKTRARAAAASHKETREDRDIKNMVEVLDAVRDALKSYCERRDSHLDSMLFHSILERQPCLMWPLTKDLLEYGTRDDIRIFCKTQVVSMLAVMINKHTQQNLEPGEWTGIAQQLIDRTHQILSDVTTEVKPKYIHEVLLLLYKCVSSAPRDHQLQIPEDTVACVKSMKARVNKDTRVLCNRLVNLLPHSSPFGVGETRGHQERPKQKRKMQQQDESEANVDRTPDKKMKDVQKDGSEELSAAQEQDTPSHKHKKSKKKKRASSEIDHNVGNNGFPEDTIPDLNTSNGSGKKKHKHKRSSSVGSDRGTVDLPAYTIDREGEPQNALSRNSNSDNVGGASGKKKRRKSKFGAD